MNKKAIYTAAFVLLLITLMTVLCACGRTSDAPETALQSNLSGPEAGAEERLSDELLLSAIRSYCFMVNPDLESIVNAGEYPVYWDVESSDEQNAVVLFRSYTGAQKRFYIDRTTGDTYATEFVPGLTPEEERTDESFNIREYLSGD